MMPGLAPRRIALVTTSRADYGIYQPVIRRMLADASLSLQLIAAGMHLEPAFGETVRLIEADGVPIAERVRIPLTDDRPEAIAAAMGTAVAGFAWAYARLRPQIIVVLGDRVEMHAAAVAAVPIGIPLAHLHGGELTEGAIDNALRHAITKLSHLHFVAAEPYARRVIQMGEEPWRVTISGAPALDHLRTMALLTPAELESRIGLPMDPPPLLVTFHPVTLEQSQLPWQVEELLGGLDAAMRDATASHGAQRPIVFTLPNADAGNRAIRARMEAFVAAHPQARLVDNFGTQGYFSMMAHAAAMVGNSSSGLIEAPSFGLPVVNVGTRQAGRIRAGNVIDVGYDRGSVLQGIRAACAPAFRERLRGMENPYGNGTAAEAIVDRLRSVPLDDALLRKRFVDAEAPAEELTHAG